MNHSATVKITASAMLAEAQGYRTSLESLMELGRAILLQPSMENSSATAYKVLAEGVLESADHQADLVVVDGVTEPAAVVELIMQDVLTPRLTDIEEIERALSAKAENEEPVPFTTRDAETSASVESLHHKAEVLDIFKEHVGDIKTIMASVENLNIDVVRPMVLRLIGRSGISVADQAVSMEGAAQTQVLGELADAVDRIETLVSKAHEAAIGISDAARSEAENVGVGGEDKLGDVIEAHRGEIAVGSQLAEGTSVSTVENDAATDGGENLEEAATGVEGDEAGAAVEGGEAAETDVDGALELEPVENAAEAEAEGGAAAAGAEAETDDTTDADENGTDDDIDVALDAVGDEANIPSDHDSVELDTEEAATGDESNSEEEAEGTDDDDDEEEEEDDSTASNESLSEAIVIDSMANHTEDLGARRDIVATLLEACSGLDLLSEKGQAAVTSGVDENFELTTDMFLPTTGDILGRHYETWAGAAIRDGGANVRALLALINN